ncbi:histidine phosphatase family protein [Mycobacterium tuberculosis]|uniref:histidine phosphatase family protein n=1 Tax=Mycobacterium tuberculosis TaxID=1773 RepID=UPI003013D020
MLIDTAVPGPGLTALGQQQAQAIANALAAKGPYAGIFDSQLIRTQQTAAPLANLLGMAPQVLPGLNEIHAAGTDEPPATTDSPIDPASPAGSAQAAVAEQQRLAPGAAVTADTARATHAAVAHQPAAGAAHAAHSAGKAGATGTPVAD